MSNLRLCPAVVLSLILGFGTGCKVTLPVAGESPTSAGSASTGSASTGSASTGSASTGSASDEGADGWVTVYDSPAPERNLGNGPDRNLGEGPDRNDGAGPARTPGALSGRTTHRGLERVRGGAQDPLLGKAPERALGQGPKRRPGRGPDARPGRAPHSKIYAADARWPAFASTWEDRVERAFERLEVVTGLDFADMARPRVVLRAFRDETRPHELRAEILEGRRRVVVHVNSEPLVAGASDPDRALLRALTEAALQDSIHRHGPIPRWFVCMAGTVAAGDTETRLVSLYRRARHEGEAALALDPRDPAKADTSGLAALVLLTARNEPKLLRRVIGFVADGDPAGEVLGRSVGEAGGGWLESARVALGERLGTVDPEPWVLLEAAEAAVVETGRADLEALLPETVPAEVADEVLVLRARAALSEGDYAAARVLLRTLSPQAARSLRDPAGMMALRIDVESHAGGDSQIARELARQLELDYPQSEAARGVAQGHPMLGFEEDPQRWLATMRERLARHGHEAVDLDTLVRYVRMLLMDHRAGQAERLLGTLGVRGSAPEFEDLRLAIVEAQQEPSGAAIARGRQRLAAWEGDPSDDLARDVGDTGRAAGPALVEVLGLRSTAPQRAALIGLLAQAVAHAEAVDAVRALWPGNPGRIQRDLLALGQAVDYPALERVLDAGALGEAEAQALTKAWSRLTFGLSRRWLSQRPTYLRSLHHGEYTVRRTAFTEIGRDAPDEITPLLVAYGLKDTAALLRREATELAAMAGFEALARRALLDEAWVVREEAVRAVARLEGQTCVDVFVRLLRADPSREVRAAAALALIRTAPADARAIDALLRTQVGEEARLRDAIGARLAELPPEAIVQGIVRGWRRAAARTDVERGYLFRTALLYGRLTRQGIGYYPGASRAEFLQMLKRMEIWLLENAESADEAGQDAEGARPRRVPLGRGR